MSTAAQASLWRLERQDWIPILWIALLPFALAAPQLVGWLKADPLLYTGAMGQGLVEGILRGVPYVDPNNGFGTQALGRRAALLWLQGEVPWWNYFTGVGLPLAAEYSPGAFFPLTFLLLLPQGMVLQQCTLQALCGLGTYGLLRQLGLVRGIATLGALLYTFNGTLAWHSHAPATAVPFLPWMLWGIERVWASVRAGPGRWRMLAAAVAFGLLCAFPETSYISGLLALAWAVVRGLQLERPRRLAYAAHIALGGIVGIAIAAPQVYVFFHFLADADIGGHGEHLAHAALHWAGAAPSLVSPYVFGPIFGYAFGRPPLEAVWGGIGGFVTGGLLVAAAYGFWARRDAISWLLAAWCAAALAKTFGIEPFSTLWNWIPGLSYAAFARYVPPSWELALVILAVRGLDPLVRSAPTQRGTLLAAAATGVLAFAGLALTVYLLWPVLRDVRGLRNAVAGSLVWAALSMTAVCWLLTQTSARARRALAALLVGEALLMTFIPALSNPRGGAPDIAAIHFLRNNLGLQRFYTLGPIQPNYGAYFAVASINHNYLPVSRRWVEWVRAHLDQHADSVVFNGNYARGPGMATQKDELRRNLAAYQWVGVKYVIALPAEQPLTESEGRRVYADDVLSIYELAAPKPYFESQSGHCRLAAAERERVTADCAQPDVLVRRELYFPGWRARIGERDAPIGEHAGLFQSVTLPAGRSEVTFRYAPPHVEWAWLAAALGLLGFAMPSLMRARQSAPRNRSAI